MTAIKLSDNTVLSSAPHGSVVGTFNSVVTLVSSPSNYFQVQGTNLVVAWSAPPPPGTYLVLVSNSSGPASFLVEVVQVPLAPVITINPPTITVGDDSVAFGKLADLSISMNDGSAFTGTPSISAGFVRIFNSRLVLSRPLTVADDGVHTVTIGASQAGSSATTSLVVKVVAPPPPPPSPDGTDSAAPAGPALITSAGTWTWGAAAVGRPGEYQVNLNGVSTSGIANLMKVANGGKFYVRTAALHWYVSVSGGFVVTNDPNLPPPPLTIAITFTPLQSSVDDTVPVGTVVAQTVVAMSDGSVFNGTYSMADSTGLFTVNGSGGILTVRPVTVADDGVHHITVTATTPGGLTASARFP